MSTTNSYAEHARKLRERYTPIPLNGKVPVVKDWQKLRAVTPEQIAAWEKAGLFQNIGMVTGEASDNTVVIDFDGLCGYEQFCETFPELAKTHTVKTGSGNGMHVYFKVDLLPESTGWLNIPNGSGTYNIEIKADGKQVVIPPSIHPDTKAPYEVVIPLNRKHVTDLTDVLAWARSLAGEEWQPPRYTSRVMGGDPLNPRLLSAVRSHFESQPHKTHGAWINASCPNTAAHKHGDKKLSFGYNTDTGWSHCYVCRTMALKDILPMIGIDASDYGGYYEKSEGSTAPNGVHRFAQARPAPNAKPAALPVVTRSSMLSTVYDRLTNTDTLVTTPPVPFPMRVLWRFDGMARMIKPGKLVGIVGVSGGGKTSLLETMVDSWLGMNVPCLVWSPEWDAEEFVERAIARYGNITLDKLYSQYLWLSEQQSGKAGGVGTELTPDEMQRLAKAIGKLRTWQTEVGYLDCPDLTSSRLEHTLGETLAGLAFKPRVLIIDYVQILHALENDADLPMYNLLMRLKALCKVHNLVGVIASQVTKDSARNAQGGKSLDGMSARYVNDDAFNLLVTINPDRAPESGEYLPTSVLNVAKNSAGQRGRVRVGTNWERLYFDDKPHANQKFEEGK